MSRKCKQNIFLIKYKIIYKKMTKNVICRVCLEENSLLYDIFEVTIVDKDDNEFTISDVLAIYCSIQVDKKIPQSICSTCIESCTNAYSFIKLVQNNNSSFENWIKTTNDNNPEQVDIKPEFEDSFADPLSVAVAGSCDNAVKNELETSLTDAEEVILIDSNTESNKNHEEIKKHYCPICKKLFRHYTSFIKHLKLHPQEIQCHLCTVTCKDNVDFEKHYFRDHYNYCCTCKMTFVSRKEFDYHKSKYHKDKQKPRQKRKAANCRLIELTVHKCPVCMESFQHETKFVRHIQEEHKNQSITCGDCQECFSVPNDYVYHYQRRHYNYCNICEQGFSIRDNFTKHQRQHVLKPCFISLNYYKCPLCNLEDFNFVEFILHLQENHSEPVDCKICDKNFQTVDLFVEHYRKNHRIQCNDCNGFCISQEQFNRHINEKYQLADSEKEEGVKRRKTRSLVKRNSGYRHICPICTKPIKYFNEFRLHLRNSHLDNDNVDVTCPNCSATYRNTQDFFQHYESEHYLQCSSCKKYFTNKVFLTEHHCWGPPKPYKPSAKNSHICPICGKTYTGHRKNHEQLHQTEANYKCDMCDLTFVVYDHLRYHRLKTHNLMKHLCPHCGRRFVNKTQMTVHIWKHMGIKGYSCKKCGQQFSRLNGLKNHEKKQLCGKRKVYQSRQNLNE